MSYFVAKKIFKMNYPIFPCAYIASLSFMLKYSNVFKPYMFDGVCVLLVLFFYYLYNNKKINLFKLTLVYILLILSSNPTCFFIGGILLYEFIIGLLNKDKKKIKKVIIVGICIFISFILYYFYWLKGVATSNDMQDFWKNSKFPLIPTSISDLKHAKDLIKIILGSFDNYSNLIFLLAGLDLIIGIIKKEQYKIIIVFSLIITLFASYIGMFPIENRMWCFIYPLLSLLAFDSILILLDKDKTKNLILIALSMFLIISNNGIRNYTKKQNVYWYGEETLDMINYIEKNIKEDEYLYVYHHSVPALKYKIGYNKESIGKYNSSIIYSKGFYNQGENLEEIDLVVNKDKCYLMFSHLFYERAEKLFEAMKEHGYLELIINPYNTPLYYYVKDISNMKTKIKYEIKSTKIEDEKYILTLNIENIGENIINHDYETIYLSSKDNEKIKVDLKKKINQKESYEMEIELNFDKIEEINLQLYNTNGYWYDELGIEPIKITKDMFEEE